MTSSIATLAGYDGRDLWWGLEVSFDNFTTVSYRWGTHSAYVDGGSFDGRLAKPMGQIQRGLGVDHMPASSSVTFTVDNTDFAVDWLADYASFASEGFRARFRLKLGFTDVSPAAGAQPTVVTKTIGYFVALNYPERNDRSVTLTLGDDMVGMLNDLLTPPTCNDWIAAGTEPNCPLITGTPKPAMDFNAPWPLRFGHSDVGWKAQPLTSSFDSFGADWGYITAAVTSGDFGNGVWPSLICATQNSDAPVDGVDVFTVRATIKKSQYLQQGRDWGEQVIDIPETWNIYGVTTTYRIWKVYKSAAIAKDGVNWYMLWLGVDLAQLSSWMRSVQGQTSNNPFAVHGIPLASGWNIGGGGVTGNNFGKNGGALWNAIDFFTIGGNGPLSAITGKANIWQNPVDVVEDLVAYYSPMFNSPPTIGPIDTAKFARARKARQGVPVCGEIQVPYASDSADKSISTGGVNALAYQGGLLAQALAAVCGSGDLDFFLTWSGQAGVKAMAVDLDELTGTYPSVEETHIANVIERVPSPGERWAPYNAVFISQPDGSTAGPFRNETAITSWAKELPINLVGTWWSDLKRLLSEGLSYSATESVVWAHRGLWSAVRPVVSFETDLSFFALGLDLTDDFDFTWTRGGLSTIYSSALFRVEGISINPETARLTIAAVWMGDLLSLLPYILDDENYLTRVASSGGRTATVADSSTTVTFSSGSLVTDGVAAGDELFLQDATEGAAAFTRFRALKVASVTDATHLVISDPSLDFGGGAAVATWVIRRSQATYPTVGTDPTHYPSGSSFYGKVSDTSGKFNDGTNANELL